MGVKGRFTIALTAHTHTKCRWEKNVHTYFKRISEVRVVIQMATWQEWSLNVCRRKLVLKITSVRQEVKSATRRLLTTNSRWCLDTQMYTACQRIFFPSLSFNPLSRGRTLFFLSLFLFFSSLFVSLSLLLQSLKTGSIKNNQRKRRTNSVSLSFGVCVVCFLLPFFFFFLIYFLPPLLLVLSLSQLVH